MNKICLHCGRPLKSNETYWHKSCIRDFFELDEIPVLNLKNHIIDELAYKNVIEGTVIAGVQKKLSISLESKRKKKTISTNKFIIKPEVSRYPNLNIYEWIGIRLASICNFNVVKSGLIYLEDGNLAYITKRLDRVNLNGATYKLPMEDFCQLSGYFTDQKYSGSYEKACKNVIDKYSTVKLFDKIEYFRMVFFSYLIGNTDMHLKNFSLVKTNDIYKIAPFYDLVPVLMVVKQEEMALTINGKKKNITKNDFVKFGLNIGLNQKLIDMCFDSIIFKLSEMFSFIKQSPLDEEEQYRFIDFINTRYENIFHTISSGVISEFLIDKIIK